MSSKSDVHMEALKFARDNRGFSLREFQKAFPDDFAWLKREIRDNKVFQTDRHSGGDQVRYFLSFDDRFKLLEHEELQDAKRSSRIAVMLALISIGIAIGGAIYQQSTVSKVEVVNSSYVDQDTENKVQSQKDQVGGKK